MNLADLLHGSAARHPDRPAVSDVRSSRSLSYAELARDADRAAAFLAAQGVRRGHRIGLDAPDGLAYLPAAFGILASGACMVPLASHLTPAERRRIVDEVQLNGCLSSPTASLVPGPQRGAIAGGACDGFTFGWIDRGAEGPPAFREVDAAFIRFTSGTTADAKGVVLSHEATLARVRAADAVLHFDPDDRIAWVLPLAYHFAVTIVAYVRAGAHVLLCPGALPAAVDEAIRRCAATVFYASPLHFERMAHLPAGPLASLRLALTTSAPIALAVMERFQARSGVPVGQAYGIIEAGLPCINVRDAAPATSVGRAVPGYEVAVFAEDGARMAAGMPGDIGVRGDGLFTAYYGPWRSRQDVTRDGWFMTGDVGRLDSQGALHLVGRRTTVIFVAGLKFFPEEVEACIDRFPGVAASRVSGAPHPRLGQVPRAEVVLAEPGCDLEALKTHCARELSPYKVPLEFRVVGAIPRTPGGKVLRRPP